MAGISANALEILKVLCRQPSVSAEARGLAETAALVERLLVDAGFETRQLCVEGGPPAVYGEQQGRSAYMLLLYNHYDVQPADPLELWDSPPFEPTIREGKLFARGTADNKAELAVRLAVIRALHERSGGLPIGIRWIIEGEEEVLSPHFDEIVRQNAAALRADGCLWEGSPARLSDGRPCVGLGFKGSLSVRLDVRLLKSDAHSATAAVVPSAAWRLVEALASLRDRSGRVAVPDFYDSVRPPNNAELRAIDEQGDAMEREFRETLGIDEFLDGVTGTPYRERVSFSPTCNIAGMWSGYTGPGMKSVLPAEASARLDFRLVPEQSPAEVLELLQNHLRQQGFDDVEVSVLGTAEAAGTPIEHPFVQQALRVAEEVTGMPPSVIPRIGGTLPIIASLQRHLDVPGLAAPDNPFNFSSRIHAPNEHVKLDDLEHAVRFTYALLETLGTTPH